MMRRADDSVEWPERGKSTIPKLGRSFNRTHQLGASFSVRGTMASAVTSPRISTIAYQLSLRAIIQKHLSEAIERTLIFNMRLRDAT